MVLRGPRFPTECILRPEIDFARLVGVFRICSVMFCLLLGCGPTFDGKVYRRSDLAFRISPPPASWRAITITNALLAFRDDRLGATVAVNGRCGEDGDDVPLASLTQHLFIHFTDREIRSEKLVSLDGREALRTLITAKLDGVPKGYCVYVLKKDGCVYDFVYISRPDTLDAGVGGFDRFVAGFQTVPA